MDGKNYINLICVPQQNAYLKMKIWVDNIYREMQVKSW